MIQSRSAIIGVFLMTVTLVGCNMWQDRAEFAAPQSRWQGTQWPQHIVDGLLPDGYEWPKGIALGGASSPVGAETPPPAIRTVHCYRTLATVDCYAAKQPERETGYIGTYPER
jgi:hypothetical protein